MSKNVAVFVDVANIFYAAKAAGVDIDYVTLLKATTAGRDFVRAYAYTGLDPENENQRNFHAFLARHGYKVVSKDIRKYGDGKVKANLDIELVVDLMKTARNLDIAVVISGDGDFASAIRAVQEMGVRVEVVSFRGNTSSDLIDVADLFTDITQIAKVEKGSSRSGRRIAGDEEDLSMTEVPEKQTEGSGRRRGRGGRGGRTTEPVAAAGRSETSRDGGSRDAGRRHAVVLPGERLSKLAPVESDGEPIEAGEDVEELEIPGVAEGAPERIGEDEGPRRRRRRRGGRGRGRGRGVEGVEGVEVAGPDELEETEELEPAPIAPRGPRPTPFGSVWDSQIGMPSAPTSVGAGPEDEDIEEPEIPEYLIAERNRARTGRGGGARGGVRGGRSAYAAALDRERYGGGRSSAINRYPDVSGRGRQEPPRRSDRPDRPERGERFDRRERSAEPWSEVPPELEEMLRAQIAAKTSTPPERPASQPGERRAVSGALSRDTERESAGGTEPGRRRGRRPAAAIPAESAVSSAEQAAADATVGEATPRRRTRRSAGPAPEASPVIPDAGPSETEAAAPARRRTRRTTSPVEASGDATQGDAAVAEATTATPARRGRTRAEATAGAAASSDAGTEGAAEPADAAPKRRTRRTSAGA